MASKKYKLTNFEIKRWGEDSWQGIPEKMFLEKFSMFFDPNTPAITKMLQGGEIETKQGIYRIRC